MYLFRYLLILYTYCCLSLITDSQQLYVHLVCICVSSSEYFHFFLSEKRSIQQNCSTHQHNIEWHVECLPLSTHYILCNLERKSKKKKNNDDDTLTLLSAKNKFVEKWTWKYSLLRTLTFFFNSYRFLFMNKVSTNRFFVCFTKLTKLPSHS